jgi:hypothetical protein
VAAAAARWQTAEPRGGVACAQEGQGGGAKVVAGVQVTRGAARSWRLRRGTAEAWHMAGGAVASDMK